MNAELEFLKTMTTSLRAERQRIIAILDRLANEYPGEFAGLNYSTPFELLIATILSAQCTDERVNSITPSLFAQYPTPQAYVNAATEELELAIKPTGYYKAKARSIKACCRALVERFGGQVPATREQLVELPGVGRKTANVILSNAYGIQAITVDTHVTRLATRLGFVKTTNPLVIEERLMQITPENRWNEINRLLITHGRAVCKARKPYCERCVIASLCPSALIRKRS